MSIADNITRIKNNIASAYAGLQEKGASMPQVLNSSNLRETIDSIDVSDVVHDDISYCQMNNAAAEYLADVTYSPGDYTVSSIAAYAAAATSYAKSKPAPACVDSPAAGTLTLQDSKGCIRYSISAGTNTVYNLTPNTVGSYMIQDQNDAIVSIGSLKPSGDLRMICLNDADNVRDLGGWSCDGGRVKYGKLFRGSRLFISGSANESDRAVLHDLLGIRHELDLRYASELERNYSLIGSDVAWTHIDGAWYSLEKKANWKKMLECLMDCAIREIPLYFHCAGGADRTGSLAMVVEAMLGVSQSDIDKDYELTSFYSGVATDAQARRRNESEWIGLISAFDAYSGSCIRDRVVAWALTLGISIETINAFRAAMIDGSPNILTTDLPSYSITKNGTGVTYDNLESTVTRLCEYKLTITPDPRMVISDITVTMEGVDITDSVVSGAFVPFGEVNVTSNGTVDVSQYATAAINVPSSSSTRYTVTKTMNESTGTNPSAQAAAGESYANVITAYSSNGIESVVVTMNQVDITADSVFLY